MQHQEDAPTLQKQIPEQMERLGALIESLSEQLNLLGEDLAPVRIPEGKVETVEENAKSHTITPLANDIRGVCERIERMYARVSRFREELQI